MSPSPPKFSFTVWFVIPLRLKGISISCSRGSQMGPQPQKAISPDEGVGTMALDFPDDPPVPSSQVGPVWTCLPSLSSRNASHRQRFSVIFLKLTSSVYLLPLQSKIVCFVWW